ncbi:MAG: DoxX family protein [Minisyncoccia bacterium]
MEKGLLCTCTEKYREEAYLILRVVTGLAFFYHGYDKVFTKGVENIIPFFNMVGIPFASICAYLVAYGELLGGLALMLGFLTHWVAKANVLIMLGAIGFVHWGAEGGWFNGYGAEGGYEYALLLLASSIFFMTSGSGKYSIDAKCKMLNKE